MEQNKKKFIVAAITPIIILAGVLLYISPFSASEGSGSTAKQSLAEPSMHGKGRGASSSHGNSSVMPQNEQGQAHVSPHESWAKNNDESFTRGKGRGRGSSHGSSDVIPQGEHDQAYASTHESLDKNSDESFVRGKGRGSSHGNSDVTPR